MLEIRGGSYRQSCDNQRLAVLPLTVMKGFLQDGLSKHVQKQDSWGHYKLHRVFSILTKSSCDDEDDDHDDDASMTTTIVSFVGDTSGRV